MSKARKLLTGWMAQAGHSQVSLAKLLDCSQAEISRILTDPRRKAGLGIALAIEKATSGAVPAGSWLEPPSPPSDDADEDARAVTPEACAAEDQPQAVACAATGA